MINAYKQFWKRWLDFEGRSNTVDFWWPMLFNFLISIFLSLVAMTDFTLLSWIFSLAIVVPLLSIGTRRLNDADKSWYNWFWLFLPFVGWGILIWQWTQKSK